MKYPLNRTIEKARQTKPAYCSQPRPLIIFYKTPSYFLSSFAQPPAAPILYRGLLAFLLYRSEPSAPLRARLHQTDRHHRPKPQYFLEPAATIKEVFRQIASGSSCEQTKRAYPEHLCPWCSAGSHTGTFSPLIHVCYFR